MHYLDNAATTPVCKEAVDAAVNAMTNEYGNPSSLHDMGMRASLQLKAARETIAKTLGCEGKNVIFTSGGTEGDNMAIFGLADRRRGRKIVTTDAEHPAVLNAVRELENRGFEAVYLPTVGGAPDIEEAFKVIDKDTALVTMMLVNNETGAIFPLDKIGAHIKANTNALFHIDGVQAYMKIPFSVKALHCDALTLSAHKIGGTKGVGALYIKEGITLTPTVFGGGQEGGIRSGTENMPGILAFAAAVEAAADNGKQKRASMRELREYTLGRLLEIGAVINEPKVTAPHIISFSLVGHKAQPTMNRLSTLGICLSTGSACGVKKRRHSHVLIAMGLGEDLLDSAIRCSFGFDSTKADADALCDAVYDIINNK